MSTDSEASARASLEPTSNDSTKNTKKRKNELNEIEVDLSLPEPPSKKAKRLLKKGKPLPPKKDSDDEDNTSPQKDQAEANGDSKKGKKERSPYGVWIGNLRFTVTKDDLRKWLVDNSGGSITDEHITRVHLPSSAKAKGTKRAEGQEFENRGFAYVDFSTYESTVAAIALSETEWHRRKLLIKDAKSFEGRPKERKQGDGESAGPAADGEAGKGAAEAKPVSKKIFVGNLGFQTTEDDLNEHFSPCGEIEWAKVATFEDTGKCKGYAWVKFKEPEAAEWAVKGFVKIKEVEETEEDFMDVDGEDDTNEKNEKSEAEEAVDGAAEVKSSDGDDGEEANEDGSKKRATKKAKPQQERKVKTRKWWVNQLHGRRLKIEHAEDDQTRYKKRYGKDAHQKQQQQQQRGNNGVDQRRHQSNNKRRSDDPDEGVDDKNTAAAVAPAKETEINFRRDVNVARLTGAAVKPEGKKITFD